MGYYVIIYLKECIVAKEQLVLLFFFAPNIAPLLTLFSMFDKES